MRRRFHIPQPCHEDWERMSPSARGRHCAACDKEVLDLTGMEPARARRVLEGAASRADGAGLDLCVRVPVDGRRRLLVGGLRRHVLSNGLALMLAFGAAGCHALAGQEGAVPPVPSPATEDESVEPAGERPQPGETPVGGAPAEGAPPMPVEPERLMGRLRALPRDHAVLGEVMVEPPAPEGGN